MLTCFKLNQPFVVSEVIDDEAVIMNLKSGRYYSARHSGALLWSWLEQGRSLESLAVGLADIYGGDEGDYSAGVAAFIASLLEQGLIVPTAAGAVASPGIGECGVTPAADYTPPLLEVYADMEDLLLLDPIHDIDEVGWPVAKTDRPAAT